MTKMITVAAMALIVAGCGSTEQALPAPQSSL